jgi:hypothetical protein
LCCLGKTFGSLDNSTQLDANLSGLIVFNGSDRIDRNGKIDRISINFCKAPTSSAAVIKLYVIKAKESNPTQFNISEHRTPISELKESDGVQIFKKQDISVKPGDYLGFYFGSGAGSPFTLNRDSYFAKLPTSAVDMQNGKSKEPLFLHCVSQGITASFRIKDTRNIWVRIKETFRRPNTVNLESTDGSNTSTTDRSQKTETNIYYCKS